MLDAQALLLQKENKEENRAKANKMIADADALEGDITNLQKTAKFEAEERSRTAPSRPGPSADPVENKQLEKRALLDFLKTGKYDGTHVKEHRDLTTASGSGAFIPQGFSPILVEALQSWGNILNVITIKNVATGAPTKQALVTDVANSLYVIGEATATVDLDPTLSSVTIDTDELTTKAIKVSLAELQDSAFDIDVFVKNQFGKRFYRGLSNMVTNGNSSNIAGIVAGSNVGHTTASSPTVIAWADIAALYASLDPAYEADAVWSMNTATRGQLLAVTDTLGRPLYVPAVTSSTFDMILGKQVVINPFMPAPASTTIPVLYGDHSAYMLRQVTPGLTIYRMNETFMLSNEIGFVGFVRAGGQVLDAGTHPLQNLTMHS
jgi:HK97 family phage major capsid protein